MAFGGLVLVFKDGIVRKQMAIMMLLSSILLAINDIVFANFGREIGVWPALFADVLGKSLWGFLVLVKKNYRLQFVEGIRSKFKLQAINEILFIVGDLIFDAAKIFVPVALAQGFCATQPLFLLIIALLFTKFFPKFHSEDFGGLVKWQKIVGILLVVVGGIVLLL
jgi:hypothetical protein